MYRLVGNQLELDSRKICKYLKMSYFPCLRKITHFQHFFFLEEVPPIFTTLFLYQKSCRIPFLSPVAIDQTLWFRMLRISSFVCSGVSFLVVAEFINEMHSFW